MQNRLKMGLYGLMILLFNSEKEKKKKKRKKKKEKDDWKFILLLKKSLSWYKSWLLVLEHVLSFFSELFESLENWFVFSFT